MSEYAAFFGVLAGMAAMTALTVWAVRSARAGKLPPQAAVVSTSLYAAVWAAIIFFSLPQASGAGREEADLRRMSMQAAAAQEYAIAHVLGDCRIESKDIQMCSSSSFGDEPEYHEVRISYISPVDGEEHSYGYRLEVDETFVCTVLEQGDEVGIY